MANSRKKTVNNAAAKAVKEKKSETVVETKAAPVVEETKAEPVVETKVETVVEEKAEKTPAKKATAKKSENVYIQHNGKEVTVAELLDKAKKLSEVKSPKSVDLYIKPEDNAVYYVVDSKAGKIDL